MKTLWIVSGSSEAVPGIVRAKDLGLFVVVSDGNAMAPGFQFADDSIVASTYDIAGTVAAAQKYHKTVRSVDGVISIAADVPLTVASVAHSLDLPGISLNTAKLASDKLEMKKCFEETGIPIPWYSPIDSFSHLQNLIADHGLPLVIKPVDSRGARGVLLPQDGMDINWAYQYAKEYSPTSRVMAEEYLEGPQISTESLFVDGMGFTPGFSDRNYDRLEEFAPFMIENGGQQPSFLIREDQEAVKKCAEQAARSLGIMSGIGKGDLVMTKDGPKVIEIAARLSGGWFSTDQIPLGTGVDLIGAAIKLALGEKVKPEDVIPRFARGVAIRYFFPNPGTIVSIRNRQEAEGLPGVHKIHFFLKPGEAVSPVTDHTKRAGFVITTGENREEAVERANNVVETIKIVTSPS